MRAFDTEYTLIARKIRAGDSGGQYYHSHERRSESSGQPDTRRHRHEFQHLRDHGKHPAREPAAPAFRHFRAHRGTKRADQARHARSRSQGQVQVPQYQGHVQTRVSEKAVRRAMAEDGLTIHVLGVGATAPTKARPLRFLITPSIASSTAGGPVGWSSWTIAS